MFFDKTTFIGIDPTAGQKPFTYVALDGDLNMLALGQGQIDDILAFVGGQQSAYVAINAPQQPNQGLMAAREVRQLLEPPPARAGGRGFVLLNMSYIRGESVSRARQIKKMNVRVVCRQGSVYFGE